MSRTTIASLESRITDLEQLALVHARAISEISHLVDRSHARLNNAGKLFVALRDEIGDQIADLAEHANYREQLANA